MNFPISSSINRSSEIGFTLQCFNNFCSLHCPINWTRINCRDVKRFNHLTSLFSLFLPCSVRLIPGVLPARIFWCCFQPVMSKKIIMFFTNLSSIEIIITLAERIHESWHHWWNWEWEKVLPLDGAKIIMF